MLTPQRNIKKLLDNKFDSQIFNFLNSPTQRRVRPSVASFLRLRSSEPLSFAYRGVPPPRPYSPRCRPMSTVAPDSSILRSQGASERAKVSSRGLFLASSRFESLLRRFFCFSRPRQSASRSSRLERERCSTFLLSALDRTKHASQNGSKKLFKWSQNLP